MRFGKNSWGVGVVAALLVFSAASTVNAQAQPPTSGVAGVKIDANGQLHRSIVPDPTGELTRQQRKAAVASLNPDLAKANTFRKISLRKLEAALEKRIANGERPTVEMQYLAGMQRVQYVFFHPETNDIILAGPAEGWMTDLSGRVVGLSTGRPVVELQDLLTALRAYPPGETDGPVIGCSIDPTAEGLKRRNQFLSSLDQTALSDVNYVVNGLRESMGLQTVTVNGVPADTHFAQVMVEADYRMKLIGIGMEPSPVRMKTWVDLSKGGGNRDSSRWFFLPEYKCVKVNETKDAMELVGAGVKLVGEQELIDDAGNRTGTGGADRATQAFVTAFTKNYPEIAARSAVFAQLRNLIDLSVAAAFIQQEGLASKAAWSMTTLLSEEKLPVRTYTAPTNVETAVTAVVRRNGFSTPMGGGVHIEAHEALAAANLIADEAGEVGKARDSVDAKSLPADQWWWD